MNHTIRYDIVTDAHETARSIAVWDIAVRVFHWLLVSLVALAAASGFIGDRSTVDLHVWAGTAVVGLVVLRIIWGILGTTHARFASFVRGPSVVIAHARAVISGKAGHYVGHNPLGAVMIVGLIVVLAAIGATGAVVLGGKLKEGPLASFVPFALGGPAKEIHEALALLLLGLVAMHVTAVIVESLRTRDNLVRAMMTGRKVLRPGMIDVTRRQARPLLAVLIGMTTLMLAAVVIALLSGRPALGVPVAPLDAVYGKECGACHAPHHPSLATAATWRGIFKGLGDHFGDDASLDPATTEALTSYVIANAAERWDTQAANRLRQTSPTDPLRITATPGWARLHRHVPDATFKRKSVGGRVNCASCHADAAKGWFAPRAIAVPAEGKNE
ncbi:MAG: cytochrome b/b6 domain-containing protein [Hyphomicrobiaceae bacterium]